MPAINETLEIAFYAYRKLPRRRRARNLTFNRCNDPRNARLDGAASKSHAKPQCLAPSLRPGDIVVIDNLPTHVPNEVRQSIKAAGATLRYQQPR